MHVTIVFALIYLLTLLLSATEMVPMSVAALIGAFFIAWFGLNYGVFTYSDAMSFVDMRIIALVVGTMIVVEVAEKSGLFRLVALYAVRAAGGNPKRLFIAINVIAAAVSLLLSDSTAILLIAAAIATVTKILDYDPVPYFISAAIMINLGGTSTLIGSVSNMVVGVEAGLSFTDFLSYLAPCELALWALTILILYYIFKPRLGRPKALPSYDPWKGIKDRRLLKRATLLLATMLILFVTLEYTGAKPEAIALGCAVLALAVSGLDPKDIFSELDWETVFFLAGFLFIVKGVERAEILTILSQRLIHLTGGSLLKTSILTMWFSGFASTMVSNLAVTLTFIPIIHGLHGLDPTILWSALVLGTNLGGVTTPMSGTVSIMAIGALKREGIRISFAEFTKVGAVTTIAQLAFATLYLIVRFRPGV